MFRKIDKSPDTLFVTIKSNLLSWFRSFDFIENGPPLLKRFDWVWKVPFPLPSKTLIVFASKLATTRSCLLSPLKFYHDINSDIDTFIFSYGPAVSKSKNNFMILKNIFQIN